MSLKYDQYVKEHKANVMKGFQWIKENIPEVLIGGFDYDYIIMNHDYSKEKLDEYVPYDIYFYGNNVSFADVQNFNRAWLMHIHRNPHHWQHWVLLKDDPNEETCCIEMSQDYIIEMICDWWSFSWKTGKLDEIFDWYNKHDNIKLHPNTRKEVESILDKIKAKLQ